MLYPIYIQYDISVSFTHRWSYCADGQMYGWTYVRTYIYIYIYRAATLKSKKYKLDLKMTQIGEKYKLGDKIQAKIQAKI